MIRHRSFSTAQGVTEHFFSGMTLCGQNFMEEAGLLLHEYEAELTSAGCSEATEFLLRFHLSDITNQAPVLREILHGRNSFISMTGQPPANSSRIAFEAWHLTPVQKKCLGANAFSFEMESYTPILFEGANSELSGSFDQTYGEFSELQKLLAQYGGNVADHTVRTWLYCRDVDNNYIGLVKARNKFFSEIGLTRETHFIASTGIEGLSEMPSRLVTMDSLSYPGISRKQLIYLSAPEMLSPTAIYGVSFERGTRMLFGDRSHYFISGTASIDKFGKVMYERDVCAQTKRLLDNVEALMQVSEGELSDLKMATVYLRDPADMNLVRTIIEKRLGTDMPLVYLKAPVCRPTWLVEMETVGINAKGCPDFKVFR